MTPTIAELIDALPEELREEPIAESHWRELIERLALCPVPAGRFRRFWALGTLSGKIAAGYVAWWLRGFGGPADERARRLNETHLRTAFRLLGEMSYLRGAFMKLGQVVANYPEVVPSQVAGLLGRLHFEAPPMHYSLLREHVRNELGGSPEDLFDGFEPNAFAAASLGQVHRARLKGTGLPLAVKIQYPDIARTIRSDSRNLLAAVAPMRLSGDWDSLRAQAADVERMLERETDYESEAENQRLARGAFREDEGIVVPRVIDEFSTRRVLTMEYLEGDHLDRFLRGNPSQDRRDRHGHQIALASCRLSYGHHLLYADPHPGNYLFMEGGRLGLLDFGCCHRYTADDLDYVTQVERAVHGSPEDVRRAMVRAGDLTPRHAQDAERLDLMERWSRWVWEPMFFHDGPFDFGDVAYFRRGLDLYGQMIKRRYVRSLPVNTWLSKNFFGVRAMLYHLKARVDLAGIGRAETTVR